MTDSMRFSTYGHPSELAGVDARSSFVMGCWYRSSRSGSRKRAVSKVSVQGCVREMCMSIDIGQLKMCACKPMIAVNECPAPRL